ncbi:annexin A9 isoform X2 [Saimiri boliviensis]|uniref:Annexin n=2 Tax=Saimiri boliviensis boliviensis TaxID=39432 RepID=A0A2K6S8B6_SAIBB|nr:annexin A9 isoform X1 [Saimiri boliviensis boliviensis]XP_039316063.1 annexin A9 isoform X1 [Saimiri boliviensis boliviensis]XP_039316064.1 annexin A9 isoform X1 [Saimiri boliviensis boliviensis]
MSFPLPTRERLPSRPGIHVLSRTLAHISAEIAPADLEIPAPGSEGERPPSRTASSSMSVNGSKMAPSVTQEILSHLGLASKTAAWGTLGTLRTFLSFSVDKDVQRLLRAITGQGVDCCAIVEVLTNRSREQRQLISRAFQERTQQDLLKSLQAALSGNLERIVVALLQPAAQFDAQELRTVLKASNSAVDVAMEILATRTPAQLQECLAVYRHDFQVEAVDDITSESSGILRDLLLALAKGGRDSYSGIIDYNLAEQDVQALQQAEGPSTEKTWVLLFTQRNPEHLIRVFDQYQRSTGQELEEAVQNRFHGDAQAALLGLASVIKNTPLYFADKLHQALQETEPNDQVLIRILTSRCETDLLSIRAEFKKKFGKSLYSSLQDAVKGDCRSAFLALCRAEDM